MTNAARAGVALKKMHDAAADVAEEEEVDYHTVNNINRRNVVNPPAAHEMWLRVKAVAQQNKPREKNPNKMLKQRRGDVKGWKQKGKKWSRIWRAVIITP